MNSKDDLYLLGAPTSFPLPDGAAFSVGPETVPGVPSLASLDRGNYYDRNSAFALALAQRIVEELEGADLPHWLMKRGLPPLDPMRARRHLLILHCARLGDLLLRLNAALNESQSRRVIYCGPQGWMRAAIEALCAQRGIAFQWRKTAPARWQEWLRSGRHRWWDARDRRHNGPLLHPSTSEAVKYLVIPSTARSALGLFSVLDRLNGPVRVIEQRLNAVSHLVAGDVLRLEGARPLWGAQKVEDALNAHAGGTLERSGLTFHDIEWQSGEWLDHALPNVALGEACAHLMALVCKGLIAEAHAVAALVSAHPNALVVATPFGEPLLEIVRALKRRIAVVQTCGSAEYRRLVPSASHYLLASDADAEVLEAMGVPHDAARVCGHPYYDEIASTDCGAAAQQLRERLHLDAGQPIILLVGTYAASGLIEIEAVEDLLAEIFKGLAGVEAAIVLKPHPYGSDAMYRRMADAAGLDAARFHIVRDPVITPLMAGSDAVIMMSSTVGIEAIVLDKPVIDVPFTDIDFFGYVSQSAVLTAHDAASIGAATRFILSDPATGARLAQARHRYRERFLPVQDGKVIERIADELERCRTGFSALRQESVTSA